MIIINFAYPLTANQRQQLEATTGRSITAVYHHLPHFDNQQPYSSQVKALIDQIPMLPTDWQTQPILVNLPSYAPITAVLLAEIHARTGHFPAIIRLRPNDSDPLTTYEVAEIINLQAIRNQDRAARQPITEVSYV